MNNVNIQNTSKGIKLTDLLIWVAFITNILRFAYSYINQPFVKNTLFNNTVVSNSNPNSQISTLLQAVFVAAVVALAIISFMKPIKCRSSAALIMILVFFGVLWSIISIISLHYDVLDVINANPSPVIMILSVSVFIGFREELWDTVKKAILLSSVSYTLIAAYETARFFAKYGFSVRLMTSGAIYALVSAIFLMYVNLLFSDQESLRKRKILFISELLVLLLVSAILQSRSWVVHVVFLIIIWIVKITGSYRSKFLIFTIIVLTALIALAISWEFILKISGNLIGRLNTDSRTEQLKAFFDQVTFRDLLWGGGINASYFCFGTNYKFLDNLFFLTMFKFGLIPTLAYTLLLLSPIFYGLSHRKSQASKGILFLIAWAACMFGLGIYISYSITIYNIVIYIVIGRLYYLRSK